MSATPAPSSHPAGNSEIWGDVWSGLSGQSVQAFTRGATRTLQQFWQRCYFDDLWSLLSEKQRAGRFLELGSGRGTTSMYLASRGCDVTMVDLAPSAFEVAKRNFLHEGLNLPSMVLADAQDTGLPDSRFECVYNIGLLEHFDDPQPVLREAMRLLAPGGLLFMVVVPDVPERRQFWARLALAPWRLIPRRIKDAIRFRKPAAPDRNMVRTTLESEYATILEKCGAVEVECLPYNPYHKVYTGSFRWDDAISLKAYKLHTALKPRRRLKLMTSASNAGCCLLLGRKPPVIE